MILITGASGNVGKEVLQQVASSGARVRAGYQSVSKAGRVPSGVEVVPLDYNQPEMVRAALKDVERVFLVGPPSSQLPSLEGKVVDAVRQAGIRQLVKLSAMGGPDAIFPRLHLQSEDYIRSSGVPYTFLRPNGFMQNFITYSAATINAQNAFYGSEGDGPVSIVDIRDVAAVALKVLTNDGHLGKTYTLTGPEALTSTQAAQLLSAEMGRDIRFVNLSAAQLKEALHGAGVPEWSANALIDLQRLYREGKAAPVTDAVKQILGREPISFAQFCRDYRNAFQAREQAAG